MTNKSARPSPIAPLGGVVVGIAVFLGVNITAGRAVIPTVESVQKGGDAPISEPIYATNAEATTAAPAGPYQTVCATCHQAEGQGMPGAFPPLAGSEWVIGSPEVPIRIALLGLTGPIEVKGQTYNATMPPPPGMTDEQIAEAITYARTHFGNSASEVTVDQVKQVRAALGGRTEPFKADELQALLNAGGAAPAPQGASDPEPGDQPEPQGGSDTVPAGPEANPNPAQPAGETPAPAEAPAAP